MLARKISDTEHNPMLALMLVFIMHRLSFHCLSVIPLERPIVPQIRLIIGGEKCLDSWGFSEDSPGETPMQANVKTAREIPLKRLRSSPMRALPWPPLTWCGDPKTLVHRIGRRLRAMNLYRGVPGNWTIALLGPGV